MPRTVTVLMGLVSEHQRDLTHSAASRTDPESVCYLFYMAKRLGSIMKKLRVNTTNMERNLKMQGDLILAEPLYIILSSLGHPDANEAVRKLTLQAEQEGITLMAAFQRDDSMKNYAKRMTREQRLILGNPRRYIGKAAVVARRVATRWQKRFGLAAGKS
jgi:adenylosuccinate lyase